MKTITKLLDDKWKVLSDMGIEIYMQKGNERCLYNKKSDSITLSYKLNEHGRVDKTTIKCLEQEKESFLKRLRNYLKKAGR
jgi:hypothetical protein